jgi:hypothetical protein
MTVWEKLTDFFKLSIPEREHESDPESELELEPEVHEECKVDFCSPKGPPKALLVGLIVATMLLMRRRL